MPSIICQNTGGNAYIPYLSCLYGYNKRYTLVGVPKEMCQKEERDRIKEGTSGKSERHGCNFAVSHPATNSICCYSYFLLHRFFSGPIVKSLASFGAKSIKEPYPSDWLHFEAIEMISKISSWIGKEL